MAESPENDKNVKATIDRLLDTQGLISNRDVVAALDDRPITRQAIHLHLAELVEAGVLEQLGAGRSVQYRRRYDHVRRHRTVGLDEADAWSELCRDVQALAELDGDARSLVSYIFTEMVNNAIDHASSEEVEIRVAVSSARLHVEVIDEGVGVFANIVARIDDIGDPLEAAQELTVGKVTTWPERHTGEGIFFSSRGAQLFQIDANATRLTIDNERGDWALGRSPRDHGSVVTFEIDPTKPTKLADLFQRYTNDDHEFDATSTTVKLFETGVRFVSRSEAKRLTARLDRFRRVELDFDGVEEVGQGFVDELFRVWAKDHPDIELVATNENQAVRFMIDRGRPRS